MLDRDAWSLLRRLTGWLDQFKDCFGHRAQHVSLRQYIDGLLGDSARKSMSAMLARVSEPTSYQAFQHFITHAPWDATVLWRRLRAVMPERTGILILDETSFPKSGPHSVGAARQYCGALGKVANCQVAVTAALWTGQRAWPMGALLYLPEAWISDLARRAAARIPATVVFQEKWRLALTLVRLTRAAGVTLTAVVADAEYGDNSTVRQALHRLRLPYALGISPTLTVFRGTPTLRVDRTHPPPRNRRGGWPDQDAASVRAISDALRPRAWHRVEWRNGTNAPWTADFAALRVTPATDWRRRRLAPEIWLLCERGLGPTGRRKHYFVSLPASASLTTTRAVGASPLGDRTALSRLQVRTRPRPFRRPLVSGLAAPHGHQRGGLRVSPDRTPAASQGTRRSPFRKSARSSKRSSRGCCLSAALNTCGG